MGQNLPDGDLVLTSAELARIRDQLVHHRWYRQLYTRLKTRVDEVLAHDPEIPTSKGLAFFESCPDDHATLTFDPYAPGQHRCPRCGKNWTGHASDGAWIRQFQGWLAERLIETGITYRLTGEEHYARYVRRVLRYFGKYYQDYPLADNLLGPTRLFQSTYLESFWLTDMVRAYDLVRWAPCFTEDDHDAVRELFYRSGHTIAGFDEGESNRQAFNNAALGALGLLYCDEAFTQLALNGPHGFAFHMRESLLDDGLWYEGETYHFATLDHLLNLAEMARHRGIDLYHGSASMGSLHSMFDGPLRVMNPDLTFPSRKDSWFGRGVAYHREIYELGYARYQDERYGGLLAHAYARNGGRGSLGWRSFLYLEPDLPELDPDSLRPTDSDPMPGTGLAILRRERGRVCVSLEYGHYGGGHGHPDRLHLNLFADGRSWLLDPGTGWYSDPDLGWYRSTLAHNTVTVDGTSQNPSVGTLTAFGEAADIQVAQAHVDGAYPGVAMRRTLCLTEAYLLDVLEVSSAEEHRYDWTLHTRAALSTLAPQDGEADTRKLGDRNGYEFFGDIVGLNAPHLDIVLGEGTQRLRVLQLAGGDLYRARSLGVPLEEDRPFTSFVVRHRARTTRFVTCYLRGRMSESEDVHLEEWNGQPILHLEGRRHSFFLDDEAGVSVNTQDLDGRQRLAWFGRSAPSHPDLQVRGGKLLDQAALEWRGSQLKTALPEAFGRLHLSGPLARRFDTISGLPPHARWDSLPDGLELTQQGGDAWLVAGTPTPTLGAGRENRLRFQVLDPHDSGVPKLDLPAGWRLNALERVGETVPPTWEAAIEIAALAPVEHETLRIVLGEVTSTLNCRIEAPIATSWTITSRQGRPVVALTVSETCGLHAHVKGVIEAPWLLSPTHYINLDLEPHGEDTIALPLPLGPTPPGPLSWPEASAPEEWWTLPSTADSAGQYGCRARLELDRFRGESRARFPLYWCSPRGTPSLPLLKLDRPEQVYWTEHPWHPQADASARASLQWDGVGLYLYCEVRDLIHVSDANDRDLYENDSVQLYLDFRPTAERDTNFTPGVAAFILAPGPDKRTVRLEPIAGSKELSNRAARAGWFNTEEVTTQIEPTESGYRLEAFFPYRSLGIGGLQAGQVIGLDLSLSDNIGAQYRSFQLVWSGARARRCYLRYAYHDPQEFGYLIVSAEKG